jgi:hypothetical protein
MLIELKRFKKTANATFGDLIIDGDKICYVLEDTVRPIEEKEWGKTAIFKGEYDIIYRKEGKIYGIYKDLFKDINNERGMLNIIGIPGFGGDVMIHCGNTPEDTAGCPLLGMRIYLYDDRIDKSWEAYRIAYPRIATALDSGDKVRIKITEEA